MFASRAKILGYRGISQNYKTNDSFESLDNPIQKYILSGF